jgi:tetratricopeptide (TPR) repeat protein
VAHGLARGWALHHVGDLAGALAALDEARVGAAAIRGGDAEVAHALYRMGVVRFKMGSLSTALSLLEEALRVTEGSQAPSDALRVRIFNARAKVRRRQKDFVAASEDVTLALELARALDDPRVLAETYLDASLVAAREQDFARARDYAERSKALFEHVHDNEYVGKLLNNLGQLRVYAGRPEEAVELLREAFRIAVEQDNRVDAAFAASSLASAHLNACSWDDAVASAERAMALLEARPEYRQELGNAQLVAGRAHLAQGRLDAAERMLELAAGSFEGVGSVSHLAGAWVAQGDLAALRGDAARAAELFRGAAEALQDVRW